MHVSIQTGDHEIEAQAKTILQFCMAGIDERVDETVIRIDQRHDALGGRLHHCQLSALMDDGGHVEIGETQHDLVLAITRSISRATRTIRRRINRDPARRYA